MTVPPRDVGRDCNNISNRRGTDRGSRSSTSAVIRGAGWRAIAAGQSLTWEIDVSDRDVAPSFCFSANILTAPCSSWVFYIAGGERRILPLAPPNYLLR